MLRRSLPAVLAVAAIAAGVILRFDGLAEPSFWLDEILGYDLTTQAMSLPWRSWLVGFESEHGPLFYATQLPSRLIDSPEWSGRLAPALLSVATLFVMWLAARVLDNGVLTFAAVTTLATSPLHVYYSREARPYALLMLLAAALVLALLTRMPIWSVAILLVCALYTSLTAAPLIAGVALICAVAGLLGPARRYYWIVGAMAAAVCCLFPLFYGGEVHATPGVGSPPLELRFIPELARSFSVTAINAATGTVTAIAVLIAAIVGAIDLTRRDRVRGAILIGLTLLPIVIAVAALLIFRHWYSVRYICTALPAYVLLVAAGVAAMARLARRAEWIVALVLVAAFASQTVPAARREPFQKLDWRLIATTLWTHGHDNDRVITAESWSTISLLFYLRRLPARLDVAHVAPAAVAEIVTATARPAWIVTAGFSNDRSVRDWACKFPVLLASPLESFRLHYSPAIDHFLEARSMAAERRAWANGGAETRMLRLSEATLAGPAPYLDQNTAWRNTRTQFTPKQWNRDAVTRLVARLGFDPVTALPRLMSGAVSLENLAEWIVPATECLHDRAFVRRAYEILLQRPPNPAEEQRLAGVDRAEAIRRIIARSEIAR
jgi:mannosyltransferase